MEKQLSQESGFLNQFSEGLCRMSPDALPDFLTAVLLPRLRKANLNEVHPLVLHSLLDSVCAKLLIASISAPLTASAIDFIDFADENLLLTPVYRTHFLSLLPDSPPRTIRSRSYQLQSDGKAADLADIKLSNTLPAIPRGSHPDPSDEGTKFAVYPVDSLPHSSSEDKRIKRCQSFDVVDLDRGRAGDPRGSPSKKSPDHSRAGDGRGSPSRQSPDRGFRKPRGLASGPSQAPYSRQPSRNKSSLSDSEEEESFASAPGITSILNRILVLESKPEKTFNKNFGYALMELNGDFVWCDPNSEKYFEIKSKELSCRNFFDMLIPFSKAFLSQKFGNSVFSHRNAVGASVSFSYVIYSRNSMNKFLKCLKKIGVSSEEEFKLRLKRKDSEDAIYHQYLKALSTRATMILLRFTDAEVQKMVSEKHHNLNPTRSFAEALDRMAGPERYPQTGRVDSKAIFGSDSRLGEDDCSIADKSEAAEEEALPVPRAEHEGNVGVRRPRNNAGAAKNDKPATGTSDARQQRVMVRQFVLLETRLALNVPMFDYRKMSDDPKIKNFEQKIIKKITKAI